MYITIAVLFTLICWVASFFFAVCAGLGAPQYGPKSLALKYAIFYWTVLAVLVIGFPALGFYLAL